MIAFRIEAASPRAALLLGGAILAMAGAAEPARAQAFQGGATVVAGSALRTVTTGTTETITVTSESAIIDWKPEDPVGFGIIDFLPAGNVATFQNGPSNADFAVLNRIIPATGGRPIALNGTVISQLQTVGGESVRGGTVAFYTPGGIIVGAKAVFDVGNLLLTTIDPVADLATGEFRFDKAYLLNGAVDPKSFIRVEAGARINALAEGSYVAIASPVIEQLGAVRVNGSTAYVAAESLKLTIDQGLFDIQVQTGSSSAPATLVHRGSTGGPGSGGAGDNHRIYMVAVPKNTAVSLLLRGAVGYDAASVAGVENGEIILSAGYNVDKGIAGATQAGATGAAIDIRQANVSSSLTGIAITSAVGTAFGGETLTFARDVTLIAPDANLGSEGGILTVGRNATVTSGREFGFDFTTGGQSTIFARGGGSVTIAGDATASASATAPTGLGATGGTASLSASAGTINVGGDVRVEADAFASENPAEDPGDSLGGNAALLADKGGKINIAGSAAVSARGEGGLSQGAVDGIPGVGKGGTASANAAGGGSEIRIGASLTLDATGIGGSALPGATAASAGTGGNATLSASEAGLIRVAGASLLDASGRGGTGVPMGAVTPNIAGAAGNGGTAQILVDAGAVQLDSVRLTAVGTGGNASGNAAAGGAGTGGTARMRMLAPGTLQARDSLLVARGIGGTGATPGTVSGGNVIAIGSGPGITGDVLQASAGVDVSLANIAMNTSLTALADGVIHVGGTSVAAPAISLTSHDIDIQQGAILGGPATATIGLQVLAPTAQTRIGGTAAGTGYTLDAAELSRLRSAAISIVAPPAGNAANRPPDVLVDDFDLLGANFGGPLAFSLQTEGTMRVIGDVRLLDADAADSIRLRAGERFELITPEGSIALLDSASNPGGRLQIESSNIVVAEAGLAAQLAADPNFAGRNAALLANGGPVNPAGYLQANAILFNVGGAAPGATLFVQNSGTATDLAGLTVGPGGLTIAPQGNKVATVVAFGRRRNADSSFTTGDAFFATVNYDRAAGTFTDESEVNLCKINSGVCPVEPEPDPVAPPAPTSSDVVLGPLSQELGKPASASDVIDSSALGAAPLIEEPVASGGDGSFLIDDDEDEEDEEDGDAAPN